MATTSSESKNTVRPRSPRRSRAVLCLTVFLATLLLVNGLRSPQDDREGMGVAAAEPVTASVFQQFSADGPPGLARPSEDDLSRQIVGPPALRRILLEKNGPDVSDEMVRRLAESLQVSLNHGAAAEVLEVSIASTDSDPRRAARVVNALARQYASQANAKFASLAEKPGRDARQATEAAGRELFEAQARFHRFLERHFREHGDRAAGGRTWHTRQVAFFPEPLAPQSEPQPGMIENPDWSEAARRISELVEQKEGLLIDRTSRHPEVRGIQKRILDCQEALEQIPRFVEGTDESWASDAGPDEGPPTPDSLPMIVPPSPPESPIESPLPEPGQSSQEHKEAVREFQMYKVAVDDATEAYERLSLEEREAWRRQYSPAGIELQLAKVAPNSRADGRSRSATPVALIVALAMAAGAGMISSGLGRDPTLDTAQEVRARLPIPVVGTISAANPAAVEADRGGSSQMSSFALIGYGAGLLLLSVLIILTAFG